MTPHTNHVKLFTGSFIEVQRLQLDLNDAEIPFLIKNNNESARLAGFGSLNDAVEIFVFEENLVQAKEIVKKLEDKTEN